MNPEKQYSEEAQEGNLRRCVNTKEEQGYIIASNIKLRKLEEAREGTDRETEDNCEG